MLKFAFKHCILGKPCSLGRLSCSASKFGYNFSPCSPRFSSNRQITLSCIGFQNLTSRHLHLTMYSPPSLRSVRTANTPAPTIPDSEISLGVFPVHSYNMHTSPVSSAKKALPEMVRKQLGIYVFLPNGLFALF